MHLSLETSVFCPQPPPLWYVTNGELTVGPVATGLLMRGVEFGRVPDYCHVRPGRGTWRELNGVREIAALHSQTGFSRPSDEQFSEWMRPVERVRDEGELCHTVTWLALVATGAENAMFHYRGSYSDRLVTRSVLGPMPQDQLGLELRDDDLVLAAARARRPVVGPPYGPVEDALAMRFACSTGGVGAAAMIPIFLAGKLTGMLEVARPGHAFRRGDLARAERIVQRALRSRPS
jgi:hypothetical protein